MDRQQHTVNVYNQHVKEYVSRFMSLDLYRDSFDPFLEWLPQNAHVLELGCGPGNVIKYLRSKRPDLHLLGIDLAPEMIREAQKQNPDVRFQLVDIRDAGQIDQKFDAIIAAFCLPYLSYREAEDLFRDFHHLTADQGLLYISCMEGSKERSGFERTSFTGEHEIYINYYLRDELAARLKAARFHIRAFFTKDYPEHDGSTTTDIFFLAQKQLHES